MASAMAGGEPRFVARGTNGVWLGSLPDGRSVAEIDSSKRCKALAFSEDGSLFAWCNLESVEVVRTSDGSKVCSLPFGRTVGLIFSPRGSFLATWETYAVRKDGPAGEPNLRIWDTKSSDQSAAYVHKRFDSWEPQWTKDEELGCRMVSNEVHFFHQGTLTGTPVQKLRLENVASYSLSSSVVPYYVATYQSGLKGGPAFVRVFQYPSFENAPSCAIATKSFFKADKVHLIWNKPGNALLAVTSTEVDKSGASYYGEQGLNYLDVTGTSNMVTLSKKGPIYSVDWHPRGDEFCVVYGFMPAKATLFNANCEPVFDFGTGPRNLVSYNAHGSVICLAGFGNLRGNMEFWNRDKRQLVAKAQASDSTFFEWCPDGQHVVTATTAPRLREGNGFRLWHYSGKLLHTWSVPSKADELHEVRWQPAADRVYPSLPVIGAQASVAQQAQAKPAVYRPPSARGTVSTLKLHENEPARAVGEAAKQEEAKPLSKSAQKNKRRREAKKQVEDSSAATASGRTEAQHDAVAMASHLVGSMAVAAAPSGIGPSSETEKKLKGLRRKLAAIEKLKEQQAAGKKLEANQIEKLKTEDALLKQIAAELS